MQNLTLTPVEATSPLVRHWLAYLEDGRSRTARVVKELSVADLEARPAAVQNSIGTLLADVAAIEMDWLYSEILEREIPPEVLVLLPSDVCDEAVHLMDVRGLSAAEHLERLATTRRYFVQHLSQMDQMEFLRVRELSEVSVTPEWVCCHLLQHEANHRSQIVQITNALGNG